MPARALPTLPAVNTLTHEMVRLILFDIDGTLIRTHGAGVKAFARAFASEFGIPNGTERIQFAGRTDRSLVREMFLNHGLAPSSENCRRFFESYVFWLDRLMARCNGEVCPGVRKFIRGWESRPQPPSLGLLTGNIRLGAEIKLRYFDLWRVFRLGGFADDHEDRDQIAVAALARARRALGADLCGEHVLVVGDTPHDIRCGRAIGAKVLAVATGGATREQLQEHQPDWLVDDLRGVAADEICFGP
jgi:phosphoglycolate phosphatase